MTRAVAKLDMADLAWVAGVLDMKGTMVRKNNSQRATPQLVLYVETKNIRVVSTLAMLTGTKAEPKKGKDVSEWMRKGCEEHCPEKHVHVNERGYPWQMPSLARWTSTGAAAAVILYNVLPFMRTDRGLKEAMDALLEQSVHNGQGWGATRAALRRLRDLGWALPPQYRVLKLDG